MEQELILYVLANATTDDPIITGATIGGQTGGVFEGGQLSELRLDTAGGQVINFYGSNVLVRAEDPWAVVMARASDGAGVSSGLNYTVQCRYQGVNETQLYPDSEGGGESDEVGEDDTGDDGVVVADDEDDLNTTSIDTGRPMGTTVSYIACSTPEGAGTGWRWDIYVAEGRNASSNSPLVASYSPPRPARV